MQTIKRNPSTVIYAADDYVHPPEVMTPRRFGCVTGAMSLLEISATPVRLDVNIAVILSTIRLKMPHMFYRSSTAVSVVPRSRLAPNSMRP